jgi:hypothetical protein
MISIKHDMNILLPFLNSLALCLLIAGLHSLYYFEAGWNWLFFAAFLFTALRKAIEIIIHHNEQRNQDWI